MEHAGITLQDFVRFVDTCGQVGPIRAQWAVDWACATSAQWGTGGAAHRLSMARGFLSYLQALLPDTEVPDHGLIAAFRPHTVSTVIGLLASTGLRIGEALRLMITDVRLEETPPHLHIRETKFHKSRFVPLHAATAAQIRRYIPCAAPSATTP
jgi:integrase/recombinase XerD